jgi:hypothetical protein
LYPPVISLHLVLHSAVQEGTLLWLHTPPEQVSVPLQYLLSLQSPALAQELKQNCPGEP